MGGSAAVPTDNNEPMAPVHVEFVDGKVLYAGQSFIT